MDKEELKEIAAQLEIGITEIYQLLETLADVVKDLKFLLRITAEEDDDS